METDFSGRVSKCGAELMQWANKEFGSIRKRKKDLTQLLTEYQNLEDQTPMQEKIRQTEAELDQVLKAEETMWYQRSRAINPFLTRF